MNPDVQEARDSRATTTGGSAGPARGYSRAPFEQENEAATRHGAFSARKIKPLAATFAQEIRERVPLGSPSDDASIFLLADVLARLELVREWLDEQEHGLFRDGDGRPQPVLRHVSTWENTALRLCDRLGLSLAARSEIGLNLAGTAALTRRRDLSALSLEELAQLRQLTAKAESSAAPEVQEDETHA